MKILILTSLILGPTISSARPISGEQLTRSWCYDGGDAFEKWDLEPDGTAPMTLVREYGRLINKHYNMGTWFYDQANHLVLNFKSYRQRRLTIRSFSGGHLLFTDGTEAVPCAD